MIFRRRDIVAGIGVLVTTPLLGYVRAAVPPFRRKLGAIEITVMSDGALNVPLSFAIPDAPREELTALLTANNLPPGGMPSPTNVTLIRAGDDVVLLDAGSGSNFQGRPGPTLESKRTAILRASGPEVGAEVATWVVPLKPVTPSPGSVGANDSVVSPSALKRQTNVGPPWWLNQPMAALPRRTRPVPCSTGASVGFFTRKKSW